MKIAIRATYATLKPLRAKKSFARTLMLIVLFRSTAIPLQVSVFLLLAIFAVSVKRILIAVVVEMFV